MKLEVVIEVVRLLKEQTEKDNKIYNLFNIDLSEFVSPLQTVIGHLIGSIYGKDGSDTFDWWCYEKEWGTRKDITMTDSDNNVMCETIEDLHQYLEDTIKLDYELPKKYTAEETAEIIKGFFK